MRKTMNKTKYNLLLILLLLIGIPGFASEIVPIPNLINPDEIQADDTQIYFVDGEKIHIYSLPGLKLKTVFGKAGQGPKEFMKHPQMPLTVDVRTSNITVTCMNNISYFSKDGAFIKAIRTPFQAGAYIPFGDKFIGWHRITEKEIDYSAICLFDAKLKRLNELSKRASAASMRGKIRLLEGPAVIDVYDKLVFIAHKKDFIIDVFDENGKKLFAIEREYEKLKVTENYKKGIYDHFKTDPKFRAYFERIKDRLSFPDDFPAIHDFHIDNGKIYVRTYRKSQGNTEFFILDANQKGKFLETTFLPITEKDGKDTYLFTIKNEKIFQLIDNADGEWDLHIKPVRQQQR